jgi:predicted nucleic acid-binding protein
MGNIINSYEHFEIVTINLEIIKNAIDLSILNKLSFWDSLIISAAYSSKCKILMTEDLNHGQIINGVEIVNPLKI